jgi:hypothetical protein
VATVVIRKHVEGNEIEIDAALAVVRTGGRLTFRVSDENGRTPGAQVKVTFDRGYGVVPLLKMRRASSVPRAKRLYRRGGRRSRLLLTPLEVRRFLDRPSRSGPDGQNREGRLAPS